LFLCETRPIAERLLAATHSIVNRPGSLRRAVPAACAAETDVQQAQERSPREVAMRMTTRKMLLSTAVLLAGVGMASAQGMHEGMGAGGRGGAGAGAGLSSGGPQGGAGAGAGAGARSHGQAGAQLGGHGAGRATVGAGGHADTHANSHAAQTEHGRAH